MGGGTLPNRSSTLARSVAWSNTCAPTLSILSGNAGMSPNARRLTAATLLLAAASTPGTAQEVDAKLGKLLDRQKLVYEVDAEGDYKLTFDVGGGRSQVVWVRSGAATYGELVVRQVLSIGADATGDALLPGVADRLLAFNAQSKLGGWTRNADRAVFMAQIPVDLDGKRLASAIELVARSADALEVDMGGADVF